MMERRGERIITQNMTFFLIINYCKDTRWYVDAPVGSCMEENIDHALLNRTLRALIRIFAAMKPWFKTNNQS